MRAKKTQLLVPSGSVLLYTIILLAVMLPAGLSIAGLVRHSLRTTSIAHQGLRGLYGAESGLEAGLYALRKTSVPHAGASDAEWFVDERISWRATSRDRADPADGILLPDLDAGETASLALTDPYRPFDLIADAIVVSWDGSGGEFLEVAWTSWDSNGIASDTTSRRIFGHSDHDRVRIGLLGAHPQAAGFAVLFKNMSLGQETVSNLRVYGFSGGEAVALPTPVELTAEGRFGQARQTLQAEFARRNPLSSLFDYVLFSECTIDKGTEIIEC